MLIRCLTLCVRVLSLIGRAALVFVAAKLLGAEEMAIFVLVSAYVAFFVILNGLDYTRWIQQEVKRLDGSHAGYLVRLCAVLILLVNLFFLFVLLLARPVLGVADVVISMFFLLVMTEHYAQEAGRLLVLLNKQMLSAIGLFVRSFLPVITLLFLVFLGFKVELAVFLYILVAFSFLSAVVLWGGLLRATNEYKKFDFDLWPWLKKGACYSAYFLVSTATAKLFFAIDKTIVGAWYGAEILTIYSILIGAAMVMVPVVDMLVLSYAVSKLYDARQGGLCGFKETYKRYFFKTSVLVVGGMVFGVIVFDSLFPLIYSEYEAPALKLVILVFSAVAVMALTLIPSLALIVLGRNKFTAFSSVLSILVFIVGVYIVRPDLNGLVLMILISNVLLLLMRMVYVWRCVRLYNVEGERW